LDFEERSIEGDKQIYSNLHRFTQLYGCDWILSTTVLTSLEATMFSVYEAYVRPFNRARLWLQFRLQSNDIVISRSAIRGNLTIINGTFLLKKVSSSRG